MQQSSVLVPRWDKQAILDGLVTHEILSESRNIPPWNCVFSRSAIWHSKSNEMLWNVSLTCRLPAQEHIAPLQDLQGTALPGLQFSPAGQSHHTHFRKSSTLRKFKCKPQETKSFLTISHPGQVESREQSQHLTAKPTLRKQAPAWGFNHFRTLGLIFL